MALNQDKILKFIEEGNFQGLQSYLNKEYHDIDSLIPPEEFINAFNNFISSDSKNITNSYKIIELYISILQMQIEKQNMIILKNMKI